jgi:hypothetical protein
MAEIYRHFDKQGALLYVGISASTVQRLAQHKNASAWFSSIAFVKIKRFSTRAAARQAEIKAIIRERPKYNVVHSVTPSTPAVQPPTQSGIDTIARRKKLPVSTHPVWTTIGNARSGLKLGYRKGARGGVWVGKLIINGARVEMTLGASNDGSGAGLNYANATAAMIDWAAKERARLQEADSAQTRSRSSTPDHATLGSAPCGRCPATTPTIER